jgi:hypothetical protein
VANTWIALATAVAFAAGKNMLAILNGGARVLRIRRIMLINVQTVAVTGVLCLGEIRRYEDATISGHTVITPTAMDITNSALVSVTVGTAGTPIGTSTTLLRYIWSSDEPAVGTGTWDEWETLLGLIWDTGYGDANLQPLTIRTNEMLCIYNTTGAAGLVDVFVEFTDEAF